ncbi:MAG: hypothetical protein KIT31_02290 [Deltaproteobacteria bacterium]|nr:hypothetical protein [Deltaproteobacteria bacterium]
MIRFHAMTALATVALVAVACSSSPGPTVQPEAVEQVAPAKDAIVKTTENGPVKATVKVWPAKPTLGESIYLRLEVEAPAGVSIDAPYQEAGDQRLGRFRVTGFARDNQRKADGGGVTEQTYTLEADTSGRHRVPPLRIEMVDARTPGDRTGKKPQEVLTDEIPLDVQPVAAEVAGSEMKPAVGAIDPDVGGTSWVVLLGIGSGLAILVSGSILGMRGLRARRRIGRQRSAYDDAVADLDRLGLRGAPDAETADTWFVELSSIVRRYLELRFEIRAPELTTEEFLLVATARPELDGDHRTLLTQFLERCDRVKFAGYRPDADESLATLAAARGFVEDTRLREEARAA